MAGRMRFQIGDEVAHPKRPEWGEGHVRDIAAIKHEGVDAQRVTVDWSNHKRMTINTAIAPLTLCFRPAKDNKPNPLRQPSSVRLDGHSLETKPEEATVGAGLDAANDADAGWLQQMEDADRGPHGELYDLPDPCIDPFATPESRLKATLETFRFSKEPRSLIDWAVMQTKLKDPLTKYTRSQMEQAFPRFERDRNQHLWQIVRDFKHRNQLGLVREIAEETRIGAAIAHVSKLMGS